MWLEPNKPRQLTTRPVIADDCTELLMVLLGSLPPRGMRAELMLRGPTVWRWHVAHLQVHLSASVFDLMTQSLQNGVVLP